MRDLWTEEQKFRTWLKVEIAVANTQADLGIIPIRAARAIAQGKFDLKQIRELEAKTGHDVIAFLRSVGTTIGDAEPYLHYGLTSYDIVDTALSLRCRAALDFILTETARVRSACRRLAVKYRYAPMIGRTHGMHAEPITFGLKCLSWYAETTRNLERLRRARLNLSYGKISGTVGTFSQLSPRIERRALRTLGLKPEPVATQVLPRDRHAEVIVSAALTAAGLERIAQEIRNLQRTEIAEVSEAFRRGQQGSSAMPHKRNPVTCEQICGLARVVRANAVVALENIPLWHERDLTNSSAERIIIPDTLTLLHYLLRQTAVVLETLQVNVKRMRTNLQLARGQFYSQGLMLALIRAGVPRSEAYRLVQEIAFSAQTQGEDLVVVASKDPRIRRWLSPLQLQQAMRFESLLKHVDHIFRRTLKT